ncbi:MAG: PKD domain-containing protein [Burkholderiaceae bacterium]
MAAHARRRHGEHHGRHRRWRHELDRRADRDARCRRLDLAARGGAGRRRRARCRRDHTGAAYYSLADAALQGALTINGAVTIRGDTDTTTVIDAMALDRAFELAPDSTLVLEDVYLFNGDATGDGGLIHVGADARLVGNRITLASGHAGGSGGAIASDGGAVVLVDTLVTNNAADDDGGGIRIAAGTLELDRVTFAFNAASAAGGGVSIATGPGAATMRNTTFWQNAASTLGGAISTERALSVSHTTIGQNTASVAGGGFHIGAGGSVSLRMSIVADNLGGNSDGAVVSDDYNIDSGTTLGLNRSHDQSGTAPEFFGYGDFGGHIPSVAINPWSPAIDAGSSSGTPILDQRGGARDGINLFDWYGDPDIGSYEYDASDAVVPPTADAGAAQTILEGGSVTFDASASVDNYGGSMRYRWDLDNDGQFDDASSKTASLSWAALQSLGLGDDGTYTVRLRVENTYLGDGAGNWSEAVTTLTVRNLAPVLSVSGAASVEAGAPYSLTLSAADPGDDTIASWLVDWGDGSVETITATGATTVTTHQYTAGGFTRDILVSATDDDGTWFSNELLVGVDGSETIERFEAMTGTLLGSFEPRLELNNPRSVTIGPDGLLYVASTADGSILRYDPASGAFVDAFVASGAGGLVSGEGPAFGPDGNLYVGGHAGGVVDQVLRFDGTSGNPLGTAVAAGDHGTGYLPEPAFGPDGLLYIADQTSGAIRRYVATTGVWVDDFIAPGQISNIGDIAWGPDGYLYVTDVDDHSIQRFDASTGVRDPIAFVASGAGGLTTPWRMAFGPDGNLYVTSTDSYTIKRYSGTDGSFIDDYASNPAWGGGVAPLSLTFRPSLQVAVRLASTAPVISGIETTPVVYIEDAPSVAISNTIDISDPDSVLLAHASVTIGAGFQVGADVLAVDAGATLNGALSVSWDPVGGVLTISGNANVIAYRNALRSIVFSNTSQAPDETDRRIDFLVDDGSSSSNIASRIVQVQAVDDPPAIVSTSAGATIYDEGSGSVVLDTTIDIADVDSPNLRQATIMMTGGGVDDTALLEFTPLGNVDGGWNAETRTLTLIGEDSVVIWRDVLRSVSFETTTRTPWRPATRSPMRSSTARAGARPDAPGRLRADRRPADARRCRARGARLHRGRRRAIDHRHDHRRGCRRCVDPARDDHDQCRLPERRGPARSRTAARHDDHLDREHRHAHGDRSGVAWRLRDRAAGRHLLEHEREPGPGRSRGDVPGRIAERRVLWRGLAHGHRRRRQRRPDRRLGTGTDSLCRERRDRTGRTGSDRDRRRFARFRRRPAGLGPCLGGRRERVARHRGRRTRRRGPPGQRRARRRCRRGHGQRRCRRVGAGDRLHRGRHAGPCRRRARARGLRGHRRFAHERRARARRERDRSGRRELDTAERDRRRHRGGGPAAGRRPRYDHARLCRRRRRGGDRAVGPGLGPGHAAARRFAGADRLGLCDRAGPAGTRTRRPIVGELECRHRHARTRRHGERGQRGGHTARRALRQRQRSPERRPARDRAGRGRWQWPRRPGDASGQRDPGQRCPGLRRRRLAADLDLRATRTGVRRRDPGRDRPRGRRAVVLDRGRRRCGELRAGSGQRRPELRRAPRLLGSDRRECRQCP